MLTKQLVHKAESYDQPLQNVNMKSKYKEEADASDMSDSIQEPRIKHYPTTTNRKGKTYKKSRRCVTCDKLSVAYCGCCDKAYCHSIGGKKHDRSCLIDHIKKMQREGRRGRKRSYVA